jgi:hypothetical protein
MAQSRMVRLTSWTFAPVLFLLTKPVSGFPEISSVRRF